MRVLIVSANKEDNLGDILIHESIKNYLHSKNCSVDSINYRLQYYDLNKENVAFSKDTLSEGRIKKQSRFVMKAKDCLKKYRFLYILSQSVYFLSRIKSYFDLSKEKYKRADVIVIGGGQILMDTKYSILFSLNLLFHICMSRLFSKKILFLGVGIASKFNFFLTESVIKYGFNCADAIMVRDVYSFHHAVKILGGSKKVTFSIDLAALFPWQPHDNAEKIVGVSTLPYYDVRYFPLSDEAKFNLYKNSIKECCSYIEKNTLYKVRLIPTTSIDATVAKEIDESIVDESHSVDELIEKINNCSLFIATRMHSFIASILLGKPALCFYWDNKIKGFISSFGGFSIDEYLFYEEDLERPDAIINKLLSLQSANTPTLGYQKNKLIKWIDRHVLAC